MSPEDEDAKNAPAIAAALRASRRAEISSLLAEDARRHPAFARARVAAVVAAGESQDGRPIDMQTRNDVVRLLIILREYEKRREGQRAAKHEAVDFADPRVEPWVLAAYERARSL
jgi:hypothetical protein